MKLESMDNKCPACGANITFNPKNQKWDCKYCDSSFTLEEMKQHKNASSEEASRSTSYNKASENLDVYHCKNCGAEVMADEQTTATFCLYCGSTAILKEKIESGRKPSQMIPFKKVKEDAIEAFKGIYKGRPLMPRFFNKKENIEKITGVYIPFWSYDLKTEGDISFTSKDIITWSDSNYHYEKTDTYLTKKNGSLEFEKVLVDGSSRFDDDLMDSIEPFDYKDLVDYNHAYLSGFLAEKYDVDSEKAIERAETRAMNTSVSEIESTVRHQTSMVTDNHLKVEKIKDDYILLPVFMVNVKYKDKMYTFAMNGQTGEIVGNIPLDKKRVILFSITIFILTFLLCLLVCIAMGGKL